MREATKNKQLILEKHHLNPNQVHEWDSKYRAHVTNAGVRGYKSELDFETYVSKAVNAGIVDPKQIGRKSEQFQLCRENDIGDYKEATCYFDTSEQNHKDAWKNGCFDETIRGQTKETSDSLRRMSEKLTGRTKETHRGPAIVSEKKRGRTKENDPSVFSQAEKLRGRTKETHQYLAEMADKVSQTMKGRTKETHSYLAESGRKTSERMKGQTKETDPAVAKRAFTKSKEYTVVDPSGNTIEGRNITLLCSEHDLQTSKMSLVLSGKRKQHKGWTGKYKQ